MAVRIERNSFDRKGRTVTKILARCATEFGHSNRLIGVAQLPAKP